MSSLEDIVIAIPAYKPTEKLFDLVAALLDLGVARLIVVDDGGGEPYRDIFDRLRQISGVSVLTNAVDLGKVKWRSTALAGSSSMRDGLPQPR